MQKQQEAITLNLKTIITNALIGYGGTFVMLGLGIATKMLLARVLSPSDLGILMTAQIIIGLAVFLASLGLPDAIVRFVGLYIGNDLSKAKSVIRYALYVTLLSSILISIILGFSSKYVADYIYHEIALMGVLLLFVIAIPFKTISDIVASAYQGMGQLIKKVLYIDILPAFIVIALLIVIVAISVKSSLIMIAGIYSVSLILPAVAIVWLFRCNQLWNIQPSEVKPRELFHYSFPLFGAGIIAWPLTMIPLVIGGLIGTESVAYYSLSISLTSFIYTGIAVLETASFPVWSAYFSEGKLNILQNDYRFITRWGFVIGSVIFAVLFLCPEDVLVFFYGDRYSHASQTLWLFSVIFMLNAITGPNESILKALGCTKWIFIVRLSVGLTVLLLLYPLINIWGLYGAIVVYFLSMFVGMIMYGGYLAYVYKIHPLDLSFLKTILAFVLTLSVTWLLQYSFYNDIGVVKVFITEVIYLIILVTLFCKCKILTHSDLKVLNKLLQKFSISER